MKADTLPMQDVSDAARIAFDGASEWYDDLHSNDPAWRRSRECTHRVYLRYFHPEEKLLELNCGTGIDAVAMADAGMRVHATDLSPRMIDEARKKIARSGFGSRIQAEALGFDDLNLLEGQTFDGAYSNFDGLNCTPRLDALAFELGRLIRPGGYFIATVLPDFCMWESLSMLLRFDFAGAFRRLADGGIDANLGGASFKTYYYSPGALTRAFGTLFSPVEILGLNIVTPPMNHLRAYRLLKPVLSPLYFLDTLLAGIPPFRRIGDHMIVVFRRKER